MGLNKAAQNALHEAKSVLSEVSAEGEAERSIQRSTERLAGALLTLSRALETHGDRRRQGKLQRQLDDRRGQIFSTLLTDRIPRLRRGEDIVDQAQKVIILTGIPRAMTTLERLLLKVLKSLGHVLLPAVIGEAVRSFITREASPFLVPGEPKALASKVRALTQPGVRVNVNQLGEEVLGDDEAEHHIQTYLSLLATPEVSTVSVKVSSICAQLDVVAFEDGLRRICAAMDRLYRAAAEASPPKLIMLDMEAYRDLELTHRAFTTMLDQPAYRNLRAGIVLQAYLPDSHGVQRELIAWAKERCAAGGAPIAMRLVKGANLAVERIESNHAGLSLPVFETKTDVDASFKVMVERGLRPESLKAVTLGVASHNLFDVAYAMVMARARGLTSGVHFEVLSGMAGPLLRTLRALEQKVLIYAPAVQRPHLHAAIAYLVRRLDENTAEENFLRNSFSMSLGDASWRAELVRFSDAMARIPTLDTTPRRQPREAIETSSGTRFQNSPETDFTQRVERDKVTAAMDALRQRTPRHLPLYIQGQPRLRDGQDGFDPSRPGVVPYTLSLATPLDVSDALNTATVAQRRWGTADVHERLSVVRAAAHALDAHRAELIAALLMDGGKAVRDADAEVSEAIDFATYYASAYEALYADDTVVNRPRGVTVVTPPWNFPLAIPLGGVFAALVTGNAVILKPARETAYIATIAVEICHRAGVPMDALQLVVATDEVATELIVNEAVQTVVLTGGTETARLFKHLRPELHLLAETGGKNATLLSRFADLDLAVQSIIQSAFGHAGQKCSATSLLIIPESLMRDARFKTQLVDAARSLKVGSAWELENRVTPLIHPPEGALKQALTHLEPYESWWLKPTVDPDNPRVWSPGIKAGVAPMSEGHLTEFFGPVLSVMVAQDLDEALRWANSTPYGLTAGFHSLDEDDHAMFLERMDAGNLYVNRTTTGAIVQRQPFGGRKASSFGPGHKAGGPNYIHMFVHLEDHPQPRQSDTSPSKEAVALLPEDDGLRTELARFAVACEEAMASELDLEVDPSRLRGQANLFRYQARGHVLVAIGAETKAIDVMRVLLSAQLLTLPADVLVLKGCPDTLVRRITRWLGPKVVKHELDQTFAERSYTRLRAFGVLPDGFHDAVNAYIPHVDTSATLSSARFELKKLLHEQSVSADHHRYGHLGLGELDPEIATRGI